MFVDEIAVQPRALRDLIAYYRTAEGRDRLDRVPRLPGAEAAVTFAGMGSSLYAPYAVLPRLWNRHRLAIACEAGEILHYGLPEWRPHGPLVAVSQSGESAETVALARSCSGIASLIAITNDPGSALARLAQIVLPIQAGEEAAISTKTYTNTLGALHLLAGALLVQDLDAVLSDLERAAEAMEAARTADPDAIREADGILDAAKSIHFIGRGPCMAGVYVGALIVGEGARLTAVGLPAASFRHGPMELAGEGHAAVLFIPDGPTRPLLEKLRDDLQRNGSRTITLTDTASETASENHPELALGLVPGESYFTFPAAIAVERILAGVAERRGLTPGDFRYGGKITSEE